MFELQSEEESDAEEQPDFTRSMSKSGGHMVCITLFLIHFILLFQYEKYMTEDTMMFLDVLYVFGRE